MKKLEKTLEVLANITIVIAAVMIVSFIVKKNVQKPELPAKIMNLAGAKISLPGVDWGEKEQTVVIALRKDCHFCTESAPFYRRLLDDEGIRNKTRIIAVSPDSMQESLKYLEELKMPVNNLVQAPLSSVQVSGTPTLLLVSSQGEVKNAWVGKLPPEKENEVFSALQ
jgi:hypothetical protein